MTPFLARWLARLGILRADRHLILVPRKQIRIEADLLVECPNDPARPVKPIPFIVDSGCSVSTLDLADAQMLGMPTVGPTVPRRRGGSAGARSITVVDGTFRFRLHEGQRAAPFEVPIEFEVSQPRGVPRLFGLKGVIDQLVWLIGPHKPAIPRILGSCLLCDVRPAALRFPGCAAGTVVGWVHRR